MVRGNSRLWAMPPSDRAHTTSYSTLIETMRLSFAVFEIWPVICQKSPILIHPPAFGGRILQRSLASENQGSPWAIVRCCLCEIMFSHFRRTPTCDGHRHRQTQAHGQYRGCIASRGKKSVKYLLKQQQNISFPRLRFAQSGWTNNTYDDIHGAVIMAHSHCESSPGSLAECRWLTTLHHRDALDADTEHIIRRIAVVQTNLCIGHE